MASTASTIDTAELRVGMFVHLDLGWMSHPFALSSFRIADAGQIATIRSLGLARVRWSPDKSDATAEGDAGRPPAGRPAARHSPAPAPAAEAATATASTQQAAPCEEDPPLEAVRKAEPDGGQPASSARDAAREAGAAQRQAVELCQRQYAEASTGWRQATEQARHDPQGAGQRLTALSGALVDKMLGQREICIRVVAESGGDRASHALNVGVVSLLMGRLAGLAETDLRDLGVGALSHDIGKLDLPLRLHRPDGEFSGAEMAQYREHVALGVAMGQRMGLSPGALLVIAQHHEHCDGSGFPRALDAERISVAARVVALVNRYDNMCRAVRASQALTPHEALSKLFTQGKRQFDSNLLTSFVRMMGVYPPGSVVQLTDDRFGLVESVNSARPLKPRVMVYEPSVPRDEALALDLEQTPTLGIRRSLPPGELSSAAVQYLMPAPRLGWFFETRAGVGDDSTH